MGAARPTLPQRVRASHLGTAWGIPTAHLHALPVEEGLLAGPGGAYGGALEGYISSTEPSPRFVSSPTLLSAGYEYRKSWRDAAEALKATAESSREKNEYGTPAGEWRNTADCMEGLLNGSLTLKSKQFERNYRPTLVVSVARRFLELWAEHLVLNGKNLDDQLDTLHSEVIPMGFGLLSSPGAVELVLKALLLRREEVRRFEQEVEDFLEGVSARAERHLDVTPVTHILNQIHHTYDRTYDLCTTKVITISNARATAASILLAAAAVIIALFA
jgi:hypothetical protein